MLSRCDSGRNVLIGGIQALLYRLVVLMVRVRSWLWVTWLVVAWLARIGRTCVVFSLVVPLMTKLACVPPSGVNSSYRLGGLIRGLSGVSGLIRLLCPLVRASCVCYLLLWLPNIVSLLFVVSCTMLDRQRVRFVLSGMGRFVFSGRPTNSSTCFTRLISRNVSF